MLLSINQSTRTIASLAIIVAALLLVISVANATDTEVKSRDNSAAIMVKRRDINPDVDRDRDNTLAAEKYNEPTAANERGWWYYPTVNLPFPFFSKCDEAAFYDLTLGVDVTLPVPVSTTFQTGQQFRATNVKFGGADGDATDTMNEPFIGDTIDPSFIDIFLAFTTTGGLPAALGNSQPPLLLSQIGLDISSISILDYKLGVCSFTPERELFTTTLSCTFNTALPSTSVPPFPVGDDEYQVHFDFTVLLNKRCKAVRVATVGVGNLPFALPLLGMGEFANIFFGVFAPITPSTYQAFIDDLFD